VDIPSNPGRVCLAHALEFWTELLAYVKDRSAIPDAATSSPLRDTESLRQRHARSCSATSSGN